MPRFTKKIATFVGLVERKFLLPMPPSVTPNEQFLHYVWFRKLFAPNQTTTDGRRVEIIDTGQRNTDAGPDVFNAKIRIGDTLWAGNVEFHRLASDWLRHEHHRNPAYNSVILHVVLEADTDIVRADGQTLPQMVLQFRPQLVEAYNRLLTPHQFVACAESLHDIPTVEQHAWFDRLATERLEQKTAAIDKLLQQSVNNWEEAFYITVARNFGFSTNALPFELLAKSLPNAILGKHRNDPVQIEALLFGQAGMLGADNADPYYTILQREYRFLQAKFTLTPIDGALWKFLRLRPSNFPTIRLAQMANLIVKSHNLFSQIIETNDNDTLRQLFACEPSDYWTTHYRFGEPTAARSKKLSRASTDALLINSVAPFLFCYGKYRHDEQLQQRAIDLLNTLPAERNHIVAGFAACGIEAANAFDTQALIQLKRGYCDTHDCLRCRFAKFALKK